MRHFAGILLGIVFVPVFFALNWLVNYAGDQVGDSGGGWPLVLLLGAYCLVGVVAGFLLASRSVSPLALLLCGLLVAAAEVLLLLPRLAGVEVNVPQLYEFPTVTDGYLLVAVAAALILGGFFPTRWHRPKPKEEPYVEDYPADSTELLPSRREEEPMRDSAYDASWGTGRNEYAEEPEVPYYSRAEETGTQRMPVTQPGQYDQPPVGEYDQQALGYGRSGQYEEPATAQFERPGYGDPYEPQHGQGDYRPR